MSALLFDTLRLSRTLREKGHFTADQAETLAEAIGQAGHDDLATKTDLAQTKAELKADIARLEAELKADIARLETEVKADIARVESELKADIARVESELRTDIAVLKADVANLATKAELADVKADILKWVVGAIGFQTVVILGTIVALVRIFAK
ncbi:MAG TPA: coiled-coil domain-containing protein [Methylocella sp.]|nr:coiled-coil domain-containing protein [Methylocella sp.]